MFDQYADRNVKEIGKGRTKQSVFFEIFPFEELLDLYSRRKKIKNHVEINGEPLTSLSSIFEEEKFKKESEWVCLFVFLALLALAVF